MVYKKLFCVTDNVTQMGGNRFLFVQQQYRKAMRAIENDKRNTAMHDEINGYVSVVFTPDQLWK